MPKEGNGAIVEEFVRKACVTGRARPVVHGAAEVQWWIEPCLRGLPMRCPVLVGAAFVKFGGHSGCGGRVEF